MRRTITTPSHFTTSIRNWRVNTAFPLLAFLVLLFFSCKDDAALVGIPKDSRLNTHYVEIPLPASVVQLDGVLTDNSSLQTTTRFLFGKATDPQFGTTVANSYFNFAPPDQTWTPSGAAKADSLVLQLAFDLYYWGNSAFTLQHVKVHELLDTLFQSGYYTNSVTAYGTEVIGEKYFSPNPIDFDNAPILNVDADTSNNVRFIVRIPLKTSIGDALLTDYVDNPDLFKDFTAFSGKYKGFVLVPEVEMDKIFGVNPAFSSPRPTSWQSRISLYYTDQSKPYQVDFPLYLQFNNTLGTSNPVVSYTQMTSDRSASSLSGITSFTEFTPPNGNFYVQGGTALLTKLKLDNFYKYMDTIPNALFNSAELVINSSSDKTSPTKIQLRVLDSVNRFRESFHDTTISGTTIKIQDPYLVALGSNAVSVGVVGSSSTVDVKGDLGDKFTVDQGNRTISNVYMTEFIQKIYEYRAHSRRIDNFAIMTTEEELKKTVSSLVVSPPITLRLYYSKPVINVR